MTTTVAAVVLPPEVVAQLRRHLADEHDLTDRITVGLRDRLVVDDLREDRELVRYRLACVIEQHVGRPA